MHILLVKTSKNIPAVLLFVFFLKIYQLDALESTFSNTLFALNQHLRKRRCLPRNKFKGRHFKF